MNETVSWTAWKDAPAIGVTSLLLPSSVIVISDKE